MIKSDQVSDLFAALSKAQGEFTSVPFDKKNPHFNSKYASLSATQDMYREPLAKHGLALIQSLKTEGEEYFIETMLTHSSGQWISDRLKLLIDRKSMQGLGSATTYAKRYVAQSILGICGDEDDDGNAAETQKKSDKKLSDNVGREAPQKPHDIVMPFGRAQGKKLGELDNSTLEAAATWLSAQIKSDPKPTNVKQMQFIYGQIKTILAMALKAPPLPHEEKIPDSMPQDFPPEEPLFPMSDVPPGDYIIPVIKIGNIPTHNRNIGSFNEADLKKILQACDKEIQSEKTTMNKSQLFEVRTYIMQFLEDVGAV